MIESVIRFLKRIAVLLPGLMVAYFASKDFYPFIDKQVPWMVALALTYVLAAYVIIPGLLRLVRLVVREEHVPLYSTTPDGFASDPVNIGIVGNRQQVIDALTAAGWYMADSRTPKTLIKLAIALLLHRPYPTAPFSNLYLLGRKQDFGFQLPAEGSPHHRHHVRFWAVAPHLSADEARHLSFWDRLLPGRKVARKQLWIGAASLDVGIGIIRHNGQLTHMVHPDTDQERDLLVSDLRKTGLVRRVKWETIGQPYKLRNRVLHAYLHADGKMAICELKSKIS